MTGDVHRTHFEMISSSYDYMAAFANNASLKSFLKNQLSKYRGLRTLDLGTGTGAFGSLFLENGCEVWGLDHSPAMMAVAISKGIRPLSVPLDQLASIDLEFDLVSARQFFQYIDDDTLTRVISSLSKILVRRGYLVLHHMTAPTPQDRAALKECMVTPGNPNPFRAHEILTAMAEQAGFKITRGALHRVQITEKIADFARYRAISPQDAVQRFTRLQADGNFHVKVNEDTAQYVRYYSYIEARL